VTGDRHRFVERGHFKGDVLGDDFEADAANRVFDEEVVGERACAPPFPMMPPGAAIGLTTTWSPTEMPETSVPTSTTSPAGSCPSGVCPCRGGMPPIVM
jgi:hypothetical protein